MRRNVENIGSTALLLFGLVLLLFVSCVEDFEFESSKDSPVTVNCILKHLPVQTLRLSHVRGLYQTEDIPVDEAEAYIRIADGMTVARFERQSDFEWTAKFTPQFGTSYELVVEMPDKPAITARTRFPDDLRLVFSYSRFYDRDNLFKMDTDRYEVWFEVQQFQVRVKQTPTNPNPDFAFKNTYKDSCKIWIYPHIDADSSVKEVWDIDNPVHELHFFDSLSVYNGSLQPYSDLIATDHPNVDGFNITAGSLYDILIERCYVAEPYLTGSLGKPITGGPLVYPYYPQLPLHSNFLRIAHPANFNNGYTGDPDSGLDFRDNSECFFIAARRAEGYGRNTNQYKSYIIEDWFCANEVHFVSEEYDRYMRDLYVKKSQSNDFILSVYNYDNLYTNVNGGVGIFGADFITWDMTLDYIPRHHPDY